MKSLIGAAVGFGSLLSASALGQAVSQSPPEIVPTGNGGYQLQWFGVAGQTYFVQVSTDLVNWVYTDAIDLGNDEQIIYELGTNSDNLFVRLVSTDQPAGPDPDLADFDGDGLTNAEEVKGTVVTDPLNPDTDGDGLNDGWEVRYGLDPLDNGSINPVNGPDGDADGDGLANSEELALGTNPTAADTDGDGLSDFDEINIFCTDPKSIDTDSNGIPDNADISIVSKRITSSKFKSGTADFSNSVPRPYYLVSTSSWTGLKTSNGQVTPVAGIGPGTLVETWDRATDQISTIKTGEGYYFSQFGTVSSSTTQSQTVNVNQGSNVGTVDVTTTLSQEYTNAMLIEDTISTLPNFPSTFSADYSPVASLYYTPAQDYCYLDNLIYKLMLGPDANVVDVRWMEIFKPFDSTLPPSFEVKHESLVPTGGVEHELFPQVIHPSGYGSYYVEAFTVKASQTVRGPHGSRIEYNNSPKLGSATNLLSLWPNEELTLTVKLSAFFSLNDLPADFIVWDIPGFTIPNNSLSASMHWALDPSVGPVREAKVTIGGTEFKTHIKIMDVGGLDQTEAATSFPFAAIVMRQYKSEAEAWGLTFLPSYCAKSDAMRHSYWNALGASDPRTTPADVLAISLAHENKNWTDDQATAYDCVMDAHNNEIGAATVHTTTGPGGTVIPDKSAIQLDLLHKFSTGELYIWEMPAGETSVLSEKSEGILMKSDKTRIY